MELVKTYVEMFSKHGFFTSWYIIQSGNNPEKISIQKSDAALPHDFFIEILFWYQNAKNGL